MPRPHDQRVMTPRRWLVLYLLRLAFILSIALFAGLLRWGHALNGDWYLVLLGIAFILFTAGMWSDFAAPLFYLSPDDRKWRWPW